MVKKKGRPLRATVPQLESLHKKSLLTRIIDHRW
jgi:hypothetical protein